MSNSALNQGVLQAKINNVQNAADTSAVYSAGVWSFKNSTAVTSVTIDNSGNVGVGVTPSSWGSTFRAIQLSSTGAIYSSAGNSLLANNFYNDGTNSRYLTTATAGGYLINGATHNWYVAPSGTAGNIVSFTPAMTIDASGNLLVGTTNTNPILNGVSGTKVFSVGVVHSNASSTPSFEVGRYTTTGIMMAFYYGSLSVGNISTNGSTITFSGTAVSDVRWKENISAINGALSAINQVEFVEFDYKENKQKSAGVTAQQLQTIPELSKFVIDGSDDESYKAVDYNALIGYLGKAIQELSAKVDAQAAEIEALKAK